MDKCKNCGARIIKTPLWQGQELGEPFAWSKINWKNALMPDWYAILWVITLMFLAWSYQHDMAAYYDVLENPCGFVEKNQLACAEIKRLKQNQGFLPIGLDIQFNDSGSLS